MPNEVPEKKINTMYDPYRPAVPYYPGTFETNQMRPCNSSHKIIKSSETVDIYEKPMQGPSFTPVLAISSSPANAGFSPTPPLPHWGFPPSPKTNNVPTFITSTTERHQQLPGTDAPPQREAGYRVLAPKPRYTAEEDLFIRIARSEHIPWSLVAIVLKERYQNADSRNSKNLQVHFSQKINSTVARAEELTTEETNCLEDWLAIRLGTLYVGVAEEFSRTSLKLIDPKFVQSYAQGWRARTIQQLQENLELARSMVQSTKKCKEKKKRKNFK